MFSCFGNCFKKDENSDNTPEIPDIPASNHNVESIADNVQEYSEINLEENTNQQNQEIESIIAKLKSNPLNFCLPNAIEDEENETVPNDIKCVICHDEPKCMVALPCAHVLYCKKCFIYKTALCPICRTKVENHQRVYI